MQNFGNGLKEAFQYKWLLGLSIICSICVASLWSANIGAFFPILEVTLNGQSLQEWSANKIAKSEAAIAQYDHELVEVGQKLQAAENANLNEESLNQIRWNQSRLDSLKSAEIDSLSYHRKLQPYIKAYCPKSAFSTIGMFVVLLMLSTALKHLFLMSNMMLISYVSNEVTRNIRAKVFNHALALDRGTFASHGSAGILAHITHMSEMMGQGIIGFYSGVVREPLKIISCLTAACFISWRLLLVCVIVTPVIVLMISSIIRSVRRVAKQLVTESTGMHHVILESLNCIQTVQSYCMEETEKKRFQASTKNMMQVSMRVTFYNELAKPVIEFFGLSMVSIAMLAGSYLVLEQETHLWGIQLLDRPMSISAMLVFFCLLIGASDPIRKISGLFGVVGNGIVAADALHALLDKKSKVLNPAQPQSLPSPHREIVFENIHFAYHAEEYVVRNVNLRIPYGEKVGIIGPNGGGKSTLTNLLCRFYDPQIGAVKIDDLDVREVALHDLRGRIALVTQQTELFNESISYNIAYGTENATQEQIEESARKAFAHEFITSLPRGYQTQVGQNGQMLSGGQRQRIALARAFLKNPEIMILDEATSQIDLPSEELILQAIREHTQDCTVLFVTHRLSVLAIVDSVIEVQHGTVIHRPVMPQERSQAA